MTRLIAVRRPAKMSGMSESDNSPYRWTAVAEPSADHPPASWARALLFILWLLPNSVASWFFLLSLITAGRPGARLWLQAFGFVAFPCAVALFATCIVAIARRWNAVLTGVSTLYICVALAWLGIVNGARVYPSFDQMALNVIGIVWITVNGIFVLREMVHWLRPGHGQNS